MIADGIQLFELFEREGPDGQSYLVGVLGGAGVAIVADYTRPGVWKCILSDPMAASRRDRGASALRSLAHPELDESMNDDIPEAFFDNLPPIGTNDGAQPAPARDDPAEAAIPQPRKETNDEP